MGLIGNQIGEIPVEEQLKCKGPACNSCMHRHYCPAVKGEKQ